MSNISANSLAAGVGAGVKNKVFKSSASVLQRKILCIGTVLAAKASSATLNTPLLVTSPEDCADQAGFGSPIHRIVKRAFKGCNYSVPVYVVFQAEADGATAAAGSIVFTAFSPASGTLSVRIGDTEYNITVSSTSTATTLGEALAAAITADTDSMVTAVNTTGSVAITSKSKGTFGNFIALSVAAHVKDGEKLPSGVTAVITAMTGGAGNPVMATTLSTALGSGDAANADLFTDMVHCYGMDQTTVAAIGEYVGNGNDYTGLYARNIARPFRSLSGDTATGSAGLTAATAFGNANITNRACGLVSRPGSLTHPAEIAAQSIGMMSAANNNRAESNYVGLELDGVDEGAECIADGNDWTTEYTNRDTALKAGVSAIIFEDSVCKLQVVASFYHPANVPQTSNAYREMRNISIIQNILYNKLQNYKSDKWQQFTIVKDTKNVTVAASREKARDISSVVDDELALINSFMANGWLYDKQYSIDALKDSTAVQVRTGGDGYTINTPYILSGVGNIIDTISYVDTSIAVTQ